MTSSGYLSFPHVHGDLLTFVAEDDVWLAPVSGGRGWRLSADHALASRPRFSRDGTRVAWTGSRDDTAEVYVAATDGGISARLTFWGEERTQVCGWTPAGEVLAVSAVGQPFPHFTWAHAISPEAGAGAAADTRLPYGPVADLAIEPAGVALLTGTRGRDPAHWKRYRGGTGGRLWVRSARTGPGFRRLLADVPGQFASPMLVAGRLAFLSDHEGTGNLYSCALDGTDLRRHTDHDGSYARQASTDGQRISYSCAGGLWLLDGLDADGPRPVEIALGSVPPGRTPRLISADDHIGSLSCDATGRASVVEVRGTVHWLTHRDGPALALSVEPGGRARLPQVLGKDGDVVWVTDADGPDALEAWSPAAGPLTAPRRLASGSVGRVASLAAASDGGKVAVAAVDGHLRVVDVASGDVTELAASDNGEITGLAWSTDSAWLAWSQPGLYPLRQLRVARIADGQVADVTDGRFTDTEPVFTIDGKYLAFLSKRSFDPVYDAHFFDLAFPYGARPYLVPLAASTLSPFGPQPGGREIGDEPEDESGTQPEEGDTAGAAGSRAVAVDTDGMADRIVALPVPESRYASLRAVKGGLAWLCEPLTGNLGEGGARPGDADLRPALQRFDLRQHAVTVIEDAVDWFEASGDGTRLVISDHDSLTVVPGDHKADSDSPEDRISVDGSRARFLADPAAMWRHSFDEAGRLVRHDFWVADLADVDWDAALAQYRPLLDLVASPREFADVLSEALGELGTSHAYVAEAPADEDGAGGYSTGLLGADLERASDGTWLVRRVVPGESSDPRARSPLAAPGVQIRPGDRLLAVDGRPVAAGGPGPLLAGAAGKPVEITVASPGRDNPRRVVVVPLTSERRLRYQDWVTSRRALVRDLSHGRIGYLHVPDMVSEGWADFHRDLRAEMTQEALIIDARGNRGGHTSQLVVEKLARRVVAWEVPRGMRPMSYPIDAPRGPVVALADEFAGSDGDIVTKAIRTLHLGPVVGARTWGGVIGIDGWHELVDGTRITVPRYGFWMEGSGWGVENYGVDPDVEVLITPDDWAAGRDTQLETAVRLAAEALQAEPAATPPSLADRPSRRRPTLPPRGIPPG
ncbi:MAG TPA: PDZ domain-containing protein [Streptosporangiaceae bacterium]|nr:PDZ domain-containing protein [Streptosporangiaceae bacterium]